jgi:hypothetical protein
MYKQGWGGKILKRESQIREIQKFIKEEHDYKAKNRGYDKKWRVNQDSQRIDKIQIGAKSQQKHEIGSGYERSQLIYGTKTLQNGRDPDLRRFYFVEGQRNFVQLEGNL